MIRANYSRVKLFWSLPSLSKLREMVKDREAWRSVVHGVAKSQTWLSEWTATKFRLNWHFSCGPVVMQETQEMRVWSLGWEDPLEDPLATHSGIVAWRISQWNLVGYGPGGLTESDMAAATEHNIIILYLEFLQSNALSPERNISNTSPPFSLLRFSGGCPYQ